MSTTASSRRASTRPAPASSSWPGPVFSPNVYFQMIGRGMRGEKNGGNDRCLVLNVRDNIRQFNRALAFAELDWLWEEG